MAWVEGLTTFLEYKCTDTLSDFLLDEDLMRQLAPTPLLESPDDTEAVQNQALLFGGSPYSEPLKYNISLAEVVVATVEPLAGTDVEMPFEAPLDHVLGDSVDRVTHAVGGAFFSFVEGLLEDFYDVPFDKLLNSVLRQRAFGSASFEMILRDVVNFLVTYKKAQNQEEFLKGNEQQELFDGLVRWVYTPGYPAVYLEPRNVDEDSNGNVWDINVSASQRRFCVDGTQGDEPNELECVDKSPEQLDYA